jgi:hypothetical protein
LEGNEPWFSGLFTVHWVRDMTSRYPSGSISHMHSQEFSPGFQCTFAMDLN